MRLFVLGSAAVVFLSACGSSSAGLPRGSPDSGQGQTAKRDGGTDLGPDAGSVDAGVVADGGVDAGVEGGEDAGVDGGVVAPSCSPPYQGPVCLSTGWCFENPMPQPNLVTSL